MSRFERHGARHDHVIWNRDARIACPGEVRQRRSPNPNRHVGTDWVMEREVGQIRGVLAERVVISTMLDPWLPLKALAQYSGLSRKTLLRLMTREENTLPHYRLTDTGKIVVRRSEFDAWMEQYRRLGSRLDELIEQRRRLRAARRGLSGPA